MRQHAKVGRALHVVVAAEDVGSATGPAHVAEGKLQHAVGAGVVVAVGVLGAAHAPDHGARAVLRHGAGHTAQSANLGTPVTFSTSSGVHLATSSLIWSMPQTRWRMNSLSSQPFSKMCQRMPQTSATSVPGRNRTYSSAWAAVRVKRGSQTMTGALFCFLRLHQVQKRHRMRFGRIAADQEDRACELWMSL